MKKIFNTLLVLAVLLGLQSCTDETIGTSLTDTRSAIIEDSSFVLTGHSVLNQRVQARTSTQLVGLLKADGYAGPITLDLLYNDPNVAPAPSPTPKKK